MAGLKDIIGQAKGTHVVVGVVRTREGLIRCDMPDGTTKCVTDEEWEQILRERALKAKEKKSGGDNGS